MALRTCSNHFVLYILVNIVVSSCATVKWVVPRCCNPEEVLLPPEWKCSRVSGKNKTNTWTPAIFKGGEPENRDILLNDTSKNVLFRTAFLPKTCSVFSVDNATNDMSPHVHWFFTYTVNIKDTEYPINHIKLIQPSGGKSGTISPLMFYRSTRNWTLIPKSIHFCIEPVYSEQHKNDLVTYSVNEQDFLLVLCQEKISSQKLSNEIFGWYNFTLSVIGSLFLLVTICVYGLLWKEQNLHGLIVLSFSVVALGSYLLNGTIFKFWSYHRVIRGVNFMGFTCYMIAVLSHYFVLSTFLWLTIMNFDLWLTLRSMKMVRQESKWKKYCFYSLIGWIFPLGLVAAFVIVDVMYRDETTEIPVPSYATFQCQVSPYFNIEYVLLPKLVVLVINIILIGMTMSIVVRARRRSTTIFSGALAYENHYNAKLFTKLFVVMGVGWTTLSLGYLLIWIWYFKQEKPPSVTITAVHNFLYLCLFILFAVFCLNDRVKHQLLEKYPSLAATRNKIKKLIGRDSSAEVISLGTLSPNDFNYNGLHTPSPDMEGVPLRKYFFK